MEIHDLERFQLPADAPGKNYVLAKEDFYFVYPTDFHTYKRQLQGGFQHGGISMDELLVPLVTMRPKSLTT
ncbi:MAG: hypothetical protein KatS3mg115_2064 [Candidatus Poribacteria bacterium]|nr:MAG: hypothetical protein KatS3mg115_2064 [Candidatus Poribacteria bacterium]